MCIPHGAVGRVDNGYIEIKPKKHIKRVAQTIFENGDPNFVDERTSVHEKVKEKKSFLSSLLDD
ncbi:hypothetical protein SMGD1_2792 [Sulfurimonas gotlandica GD1]|uniref:Uncharacterized protein n=1 Tax=Sulfurimonas gotlandica (strain DSM 19862 / JCM 16533 / GD1) TaxID=929558 RepID=B6BJR5_SULGG|nr:hypothetical protein [Sulfurimonas gotlandica]EDZ62489.1 hypothetical protein CBGD1_2056 [Sulfurimonas gotlandica GD1]EHP31314.1 hypothetical protein SMGD1_2792 [Sulfurimonas gotlandica GD1]